MEPGSCSRWSWADEVEAAEVAAADLAVPVFNLPPMAAKAHATLMLQATSLNPDADPFLGSPGRSGGRLAFSDSEASLSDLEASPAVGDGTAARPLRRNRCRRRRRHRRGARAGAECLRCASPPPRRQLASVVVHPPRMSTPPDAEGFRTIESRRRWRRAVAPPLTEQPRPVPANLVGKCFNCLSESHVKADCTGPARCFNCLQAGHQARDCPFPLRQPVGGAKRGRSPTLQAHRAGRVRRRHSSKADTTSARSVSTGRSLSIPPGCEPPTPDVLGRSPSPGPRAQVDAGDGPSSAVAGSSGDLAADQATAGDGDAGAGPSAPPPPQRGIPRSLLRRPLEPPVSPGTRATNPLLELVVMPRTAEIQAAEEALSLALLAMVLGTRPPVSPAMLQQHLLEHYNVPGDLVSVRRTRPDDFIVRFSRRDDLERVLGSPPPQDAPFAIRWRRWHRLITGSSGAFRYRALVAMKGIPAHARSVEVAQTLLGSSGCKVVIANPDALNDPDDEREMFVAIWCAHPDLIPDQKILALPEPEEEHDGGPPLYLRPWEIIETEVPALRYLVQMRLVEFQDWHTPPTSDDDDDSFLGHRDTDSDSGDSNYNGYWSGVVESRGAGSRPTTTRYGGDGDPRLGRGSGRGSFVPRQREAYVQVGQYLCPLVEPCSPGGSRLPGAQTALARDSLALDVDIGGLDPRSHSPVKSLRADPMHDEAAFCTSPKASPVSRPACAFSIDRDPRLRRDSWGPRTARGSCLNLQEEMSGGCRRLWPSSEDGPGFLFVPTWLGSHQVVPSRAHSEAKMSGPEDGNSTGPNSPRTTPVAGLDSVFVDPEPTTPPRHTSPPRSPATGNATSAPSVTTFIKSQVCIPISPPVLPDPPKLRAPKRRRASVLRSSPPRRSGRLAAKSRRRAPNPTVQAQNVMMLKWGCSHSSQMIGDNDATAFNEYEALYGAPLSESKREAVRALFAADAMVCNTRLLDGVELEELM